MKSRFFILILVIVFSAHINCNSNSGEVHVKPRLQLSARPGGINYLDTTHIIHIATTLFNPTADTINFISMTCSYEDMFLTDTSAFRIQSRYDCYGNGPAVISIPPQSKLDQLILVRPTSREVSIADYTIRIGMYYLQPSPAKGFQGIIKQYENRHEAEVIWSNEIDLKRIYRQIYK